MDSKEAKRRANEDLRGPNAHAYGTNAGKPDLKRALKDVQKAVERHGFKNGNWHAFNGAEATVGVWDEQIVRVYRDGKEHHLKIRWSAISTPDFDDEAIIKARML